MTIPIDKCLGRIGNRFMLATVVSRRWEQLIMGGRPMVATRDPRSVKTVLREVDEEKLRLDEQNLMIERLGEPVEPLVPIEGTEEEALIPMGAAGDEERDAEIEDDDEGEE